MNGASDGRPGQHGVEDVEDGVLEVGEKPHKESADVAELRAGLDHLGQAQLRSLRRVGRNEERSNEHADGDRDQGPDQVPARGDADEPHRRCGDLRVAHEPQRPDAGDFPVALVQRDVVDRADFKSAALGLARC